MPQHCYAEGKLSCGLLNAATMLGREKTICSTWKIFFFSYNSVYYLKIINLTAGKNSTTLLNF